MASSGRNSHRAYAARAAKVMAGPTAAIAAATAAKKDNDVQRSTMKLQEHKGKKTELRLRLNVDCRRREGRITNAIILQATRQGLAAEQLRQVRPSEN